MQHLYRSHFMAYSLTLLTALALGTTVFADPKTKTATGEGERDQSKSQQGQPSKADTKDPTTYISDFIDEKAEVHGQDARVKDIEKGLSSSRLVIVTGDYRSGKSSLILKWFRAQKEKPEGISVKKLNFQKIAEDHATYEIPKILQSVAAYIATQNRVNPKKLTVLLADNLGPMGEFAKIFLEAVKGQGAPTIAESSDAKIDDIARTYPDFKPSAKFVRPDNLDTESLRSAVRDYVTEVHNQYRTSPKYNRVTIELPEGFVDEVVRIIDEYMPDNKIHRAREFVDSIFYEFFTEQYLQRGQVAKWRDKLNRIKSDLYYRDQVSKSSAGAADLQLEVSKLEAKIQEAKAPAAAQIRLAEIEIDLEVQRDSLKNLKPVKSSRFSLNFFSKSTPSTDAVDSGESLRNHIAELEAEQKRLTAEVAAQGNGEKPSTRITKHLMHQVAAELTQLPVEMFSADMSKILERLPELTDAKIFGQAEPKMRVIELIRTLYEGMARSGVVVVALSGDAGVGKTKLMEVLAKELRWGWLYKQMETYKDQTKMNEVVAPGRGYEGWTPTGEGTLVGDFKKLPKWAIVLLDEFEKAYFEISQLFMGMWDRGKTNDGFSLEGKVFALTINQGGGFWRLLELALEIDSMIKEGREASPELLKKLNFEITELITADNKTSPQRFGNMFGGQGEAKTLQSELERILNQFSMIEEAFEKIRDAQGKARFRLEQNAFGKYLQKLDPARWPDALISRITFISMRPHTKASISRTVEKFMFEFREEIKKRFKVDVYATDEALKEIEAPFDRKTGARPLETNLRNDFTNATLDIIRTMDRNSQVPVITVENGDFKAVAEERAVVAQALREQLGEAKARADTTELGNERRKTKSGIIRAAVLRAAKLVGR